MNGWTEEEIFRVSEECRVAACIAVQEMESGKEWDYDRGELVGKDEQEAEEEVLGIGGGA